ncbi:MAG: glycyl-radical enzyme activating protein [Planctomycetota bacterium]|nr:glycyl-radical enzyme activating protein [Planctomycetota bacterium]
MTKGMVFDIQRFSIHDGPGIRTTVFMKGCPLKCLWCQNPESISSEPELMFFANRCIGCGQCVRLCPQKAQRAEADPQRKIDRARCRLCLKCAANCPSTALQAAGRQMSVEQVMAQVRADSDFYASSGGGVTLSGGEPLAQPKFAAALLKQCKKEGFHTVLDTCGYCRWETFQKVLQFVDLVLYDVKLIDPEKHLKYTGVSNELILENLVKLSKNGVPVRVRVPIVPGCTDGRENIDALARFLKDTNVETIDLIPYHRLGESKYRQLGRKHESKGIRAPASDELANIRKQLNATGKEEV